MQWKIIENGGVFSVALPIKWFAVHCFAVVCEFWMCLIQIAALSVKINNSNMSSKIRIEFEICFIAVSFLCLSPSAPRSFSLVLVIFFFVQIVLSIEANLKFKLKNMSEYSWLSIRCESIQFDFYWIFFCSCAHVVD